MSSTSTISAATTHRLDPIPVLLIDSALTSVLLANKNEFVSCSVCSGHRIPEGAADVHVFHCAKKYEKYPTTDNIADFISKKVQHNDSNMLIVPNFELKPTCKKSEKFVEQSSSNCLIELLTAERDAKRRRSAHRGKRVHSNKKSYNEILKEVIDNEMRTFEECTRNETEESIYALKNEVELANKKEFIYCDIGSLHYRENPYKRWKTIHEEEQKFLKTVSNHANLLACFHYPSSLAGAQDRKLVLLFC
ncbi:hypothetical protein PGB90_003998 [Kerria lacca]